MSTTTTTTTTTTPAFADERDDALWTTAVKSARMAHTYGVKVTTVLARLAASRVLAGEDVGILATMVADDANMRAAGIKSSSIRAYGAPLKRLAAVLPPAVFEALLMSDKSVTVTTADKWSRDPDMTSAKVDRALGGLAVDRTDIAARLAEIIPSPVASAPVAEDKGASAPVAEDKGASAPVAEDKGTSYGDALEALVDAAQVLLNMTTRGELSDAQRRMMMRNVAQLHAAFDAACSVASDK